MIADMTPALARDDQWRRTQQLGLTGATLLDLERCLERRYALRPCPRCGGKQKVAFRCDSMTPTVSIFSVCHDKLNRIDVTSRELAASRGSEGELLRRIIRELDFKARPKLTYICAKQALRKRRL